MKSGNQAKRRNQAQAARIRREAEETTDDVTRQQLVEQAHRLAKKAKQERTER